MGLKYKDPVTGEYKRYNFPIIKGEKGDKGDSGSGIHVGVEAPTDPMIGLWFDPSTPVQVEQDMVNQLNSKMELLESETNKKLDALSNKTYHYSVADFKTNENTWEQAIQTCFDTVKDEFGHVGSEEQPQNGLGATIFFPKGTYSFNEVVLSAYGVTLTGEGVIDGTIKVSNSQIYWLDVKFEGLSFIHKTKKNSIVFENTRRIQVTRCNFINSDCCIKFLWGDTSLMQSCNKIDISNNNMHSCSYGVYIDERENSYRVGDIIVSNNRIQSTITCLHLPSCDGAMINNNVMFNRDGEHCIYSNFCNFFKISENNLFESGAECINIKQFMNVTISNNNIAWSGQLKMTPAIHLSDYDLGDSTKFNNSIVSGNNFDRPSGSALKLRNVGGINVVGNNILNAGSDTFYRGVGIPILESTNVFDVDSTVVNSFFTNNNSPYNPLNGLRLSDGLNNNRRDVGFTNNAERITISDNNAVSTIEIHGITSEIVFNPYQYSKIATINGGVRGQFLTIYCFAEGHSVTNTGNIVLAEGTDEVNIPKGKSITFRNVYEKWREVSRDF